MSRRPCSRTSLRVRLAAGIGALVGLALAAAVPAGAEEGHLPRIVSRNGRHALLVDGAPFLMLGAQVNNSSAWATAMSKVWPTMDALHINTVEVSIVWEQIDPFTYQDPNTYASGGPAQTVIDVWKAAAPHIDVLTPDIYHPNHAAYVGFRDAYQRPDNPLFVPETGRSKEYARFFVEAVGRGAIGWAPFGMDQRRFSNSRPVAPIMDEAAIAPFAANYALFRPIGRLWARLAFEGKTWGYAEPNDPADKHMQVMKLGRHTATATFCRGDFGDAPPKGNEYPSGGVAIAELTPGEYLVTGFHARVEFGLADPTTANLIFDRVEQGHYAPDGRWVFERVWNGDRVDCSLNLSAAPQMLHVKLATYPK